MVIFLISAAAFCFLSGFLVGLIVGVITSSRAAAEPIKKRRPRSVVW